MTESLAGLAIAITRPQRQNDALIEQLRARGADATAIPLLSIEPLTDPAQRQHIVHCLQTLPQYYAAIFVSQNAAEQMLAALADHQLPWPTALHTIAVGSATAQYLADHGIVATSPTRMDSEGMLALPVLQTVQDQRCLIIRGAGGRTTLANTLRARGANVDFCELYRRTLPTAAAASWQQWIDCQHARALVCINSVESLQHLLQIDAQAPTRGNLTLIVPGARVARHAQEAGFVQLHTADNATDASMLQAITHWYQP